MKTARYGWRITQDLINAGAEPCYSRKHTMGPCDMRQEEGCRDTTTQFRLYDDDDVLYFVGWIWGDYDGCEPMDDIGRAYGCTRIDILNQATRRWTTV